MRLWTLHPKYLDVKGLVALWREGLLAQAVLGGKTRGYVNHPQLIRFRAQPDPNAFLCAYLQEVLAEADHRGYNFNADKVQGTVKRIQPVDESEGQLLYEWQHLLEKLERRDKEWCVKLTSIKQPESHPLFNIVPGKIQSWEKV